MFQLERYEDSYAGQTTKLGKPVSYMGAALVIASKMAVKHGIITITDSTTGLIGHVSRSPDDDYKRVQFDLPIEWAQRIVTLP